jgi:hypothetical protein
MTSASPGPGAGEEAGRAATPEAEPPVVDSEEVVESNQPLDEWGED